jgi:four helix bundle protein
MAKTFETLKVWKQAIELIIKIYHVTKNFPQDEINGITSQIRCAGISISRI